MSPVQVGASASPRPSPIFPPSMAADVTNATAGIGDVIRSANLVEGQAQKMWGTSSAYNALAGSRAGGAIIGSSQALSRAVLPASDVAAALNDLAKAQHQAALDVFAMNASLTNPQASTATRIAASLKATQSASDFMQKQKAFLGSLSAADRAYLEANPTYSMITRPMRPVISILGRVDGSYLTPVVKVSSILGAGAGIVLGGIALPGLVNGTVAAGRKLATLVDDPTAKDDQKLDALADTTRGSASIVYAANGIRTGFETLGTWMGQIRILAEPVSAVASSSLISGASRILTTAFKVLLPFADAGMVVADGVKLKHTLADAKATFADKARGVLAVSLDALKVATYLFPATEGVRMAYLIASLGQVGLTAADVSRTVLSEVGSATGSLIDGVMHPPAGVVKLEATAAKGIAWLGSELKAAGAAIAEVVAHPSESLNSAKIKAQAWSHVASESLQLATREFDRLRGRPVVEAPIAPQLMGPLPRVLN